MANDERKSYFRFEKLEVWKDSRAFVSLVYRVTGSFPKQERFGIVDQTRRAALSIVLNIAEGSTRKSDPDFTRYLIMAQGSVNEVVAAFYVALDLNYVDQEQFDVIYDRCSHLNARLNALMKSINT